MLLRAPHLEPTFHNVRLIFRAILFVMRCLYIVCYGSTSVQVWPTSYNSKINYLYRIIELLLIIYIYIYAFSMYPRIETNCGILYQFCMASNYSDGVYEILKKVKKNCIRKAILSYMKTRTNFITEYSPVRKIILWFLTLINDTFYQITQSFN